MHFLNITSILLVTLAKFTFACMKTAEPGTTTLSPPTRTTLPITTTTSTVTPSTSSMTTSTSTMATTSVRSNTSSTTTAMTSAPLTNSTTTLPSTTDSLTCNETLVTKEGSTFNGTTLPLPPVSYLDGMTLTIVCEGAPGTLVLMELNDWLTLSPGEDPSKAYVQFTCSDGAWWYSSDGDGVPITKVTCGERYFDTQSI